MLQNDNFVDLKDLRESLENASEQAIWLYRRHPSERAYAVAYGKLDGIFQRTLIALRATGVDVAQGWEVEIVRGIAMKFQAELLQARS